MLFSYQDEKVMKLMIILYRNNNHWVHYNDLSVNLGVSRKTVKTYLLRLEDTFSHLTEFHYSGAMVKVYFYPNFGLMTMQKTFLNQTLVVKILRETFFEPNMNKIDLAMLLDTSESSIYRSIQFLNEQLDGVYHLKYSYSDLEFQGDESEILKFYINFFIETNQNPMSWPFEREIEEENINVIARHIAKYAEKKNLSPHFMYIKMAIAIAIIRFWQGYSVPKYEMCHHLLDEVKKLCQDKKVYHQIRNWFPDDKKKMADFLYQILAHCFSEQLPLVFYEIPYRPSDNVSYLYYQERLKLLQDKYHLALDDTDRLYHIISVYLKFKLSSISAKDFFVNRSEYFLNYVKFFNVNFYNDLYHIIKEYLEIFFPEQKEKVYDLMYAIYTLCPDLIDQLLKNQAPIQVLIISHRSHSYAQTLEHMIHYNFHRLMNVKIYSDYEIDFQRIKQSDYDVIISDFIIEADVGDKLVFSFEELPMFDTLQDFFKEIITHRMENKLAESPDECDFFEEMMDYRFD